MPAGAEKILKTVSVPASTNMENSLFVFCETVRWVSLITILVGEFPNSKGQECQSSSVPKSEPFKGEGFVSTRALRTRETSSELVQKCKRY